MFLGVGRKWKLFALLSIIIPMGLLTSLKMARIMPELEEVATIWTEPVYWTFSRPFELFQMKEIVENAYSTDETTAFLHVFVSSYHENDVWYPPFFGRDGLVFTIGIN